MTDTAELVTCIQYIKTLKLQIKVYILLRHFQLIYFGEKIPVYLKQQQNTFLLKESSSLRHWGFPYFWIL